MHRLASVSPAVLIPFLLTLSATVPGTLTGCGDPANIDCSQIFTGPVCGSDGKTFKNDCFADQAGVYNHLDGACPLVPCGGAVCGNDGRSYVSDCFAELSGVTVYLTGTCPFSPCSGAVCGEDGKTYASDCFAVLSGVDAFTPGSCPP